MAHNIRDVILRRREQYSFEVILSFTTCKLSAEPPSEERDIFYVENSIWASFSAKIYCALHSPVLCLAYIVHVHDCVICQKELLIFVLKDGDCIFILKQIL